MEKDSEADEQAEADRGFGKSSFGIIPRRKRVIIFQADCSSVRQSPLSRSGADDAAV